MDCEGKEGNSDNAIKSQTITKETDQDMEGNKVNVAIKTKVDLCPTDNKIHHIFSEAHSEKDECSLKRQSSQVIDYFFKENEMKDNEHKWKAHANFGENDMCMVESDVQDCEEIVTDSFLSTPTSLKEGTRRQQ